MATLRFTLKGVSPLLMHSPKSFMTREDTSSISRKEIPSPEDEAAASRYLLPDNTLCFPAVGVRNCILNATKGQRVSKKAAMPYFSAALLIADEWFPFIDDNGEPLVRYSVDIRRAVIQRQGISRARPRIELPWNLSCAFEYNEGLINTQALAQVLAIAGQTVGIGDYRVERKGWFGRFTSGEVIIE